MVLKPQALLSVAVIYMDRDDERDPAVVTRLRWQSGCVAFLKKGLDARVAHEPSKKVIGQGQARSLMLSQFGSRWMACSKVCA